MKVLLYCSQGFETIEASPFIDVMGWARNDFGYDVDVVTCGLTKEVESTFGLHILADILLDEVAGKTDRVGLRRSPAYW